MNNRHDSRGVPSSRMPPMSNMNHHYQYPPPSRQQIGNQMYGQQYMAWPNHSVHNYRDGPSIASSHFQHQHHHQALHPSPQFVACKQLENRIQQLHMVHIYRDEGLDELENRNKLDSMIEEYLTLASPQNKFFFPETLICLRQSVQRSTFSPSKAIVAFSSIERYATNLINYPWREEFKKIYAYNGFFFRSIDSVLEDYVRIMNAMGFQFNKDECVFTLQDFDQESITRVSLDCLIAIVILRQMLRIQEQVPASTFRQVFKILDKYYGDTESAIKLLAHVVEEQQKERNLIQFDSLPDYSMERPSRLPIESNRNDIIPPPNGYLESDLDSIEFIDKSPRSPSTSMRSSTSYPQLPKGSPSKGSPKTSSKARPMGLEEKIAQQMDQFHIGSTKRQQPEVNSKGKLPSKNDRATERYRSSSQSSPAWSSRPKLRQWVCKHCSTENPPELNICEICSKSRSVGNESIPLESGGKYCSSCTLVNSKDETVCRICCSELDATYI